MLIDEKNLLNKNKPKKVEGSKVNRLHLVNSRESLQQPDPQIQIIKLENYKTLGQDEVKEALQMYLDKKNGKLNFCSVPSKRPESNNL